MSPFMRAHVAPRRRWLARLAVALLAPLVYVPAPLSGRGRRARRADQVAVMMYDTGIPLAKPYEALMARWTAEVLRDAAPTPVLLGVPTYDDADKPWHRPWVENLPVALRGVHRGLGERAPANLQGVAVYAEWETDAAEWRWLRGHFLAP
jgi:hypothetical protein